MKSIMKVTCIQKGFQMNSCCSNSEKQKPRRVESENVDRKKRMSGISKNRRAMEEKIKNKRMWMPKGL